MSVAEPDIWVEEKIDTFENKTFVLHVLNVSVPILTKILGSRASMCFLGNNKNFYKKKN